MSNLRTRILALLLAVSMLAGYVLPAAAEEYQPGTEITGEVEPTPAPEEPATEPPTEAPTQAPTEPATEAPTQEVTEAPTAETDPVETEPEETDPEETNPEETEPEETEPEETEPEEEEKEAPYPEPVLYFAAPAEESLVYGMNVVNPGTSDICWDFPVSSATAVRCGGTLFATLRVPTFSPYRYLYFGSQAALEERMSQGGAFPVAEGVLNNGERVFHFTVGAADNSRVTVCLIAPDATQESGYLLKEQELTIPSVPVADLALYADDTAEAAVTSGFHVVEYPAAPEEEQDVSGKLFVAEQGTNNICSIFKIEKATAVKDENNIYVTVYVTPPARTILTYDYLYFGDLTALREQLEAGGGLDVVGSESVELEGLGDRQVFHFTLPATAAGTRVPVCILKSDLTASAPYNSSELELVVPADIQEVEVKKDPVPTPVSYPAAPFSEQDVSGQLFVAKQGVDTVYTMFNVSTATAVKDDKNIYVTIQVNPAASGAFTYSYLYFGTRTDLIAQLDAGGEFDVVAGVNGSATQSYHFTLPLSAEGTRVPVCILKGDLTAKSPYNSSELELIVPKIPEGKITPVPTPVSYPAAPFDEEDVTGKLFVAKQGVDTVYTMFNVSTATAVKDDKNIYVTIQVNPAASGAFTYSYLYFGTKTELEAQLKVDGPFDVVGGVNGAATQSYHFTLPLSTEGTRVPVCILKGDLTAKSPYNSSELELVVPEIAEGKITPVPTPVTYPDAPGEEQDLTGKLFVAKADAPTTVYSMFKVSTATAVKDDKNIYVTIQVNPAASGAFTYSYLYFGTKTELEAQLKINGPFDVVGGVNGTATQSYHFTLPLNAEGTNVPVCILKSDLTAKSPYNSSELVLVVPADIPEVEVKKDPVPTPVSYPAAPADEQDVSGKLFVAKQGADAIYPMFKIETATAIKDENLIYVTVQVNKAASGAFTYSYLYFGTRTALVEQLDAGGEFGVVAGVAGSDTQAYHFTLPLSAAGTRVPVCILKGDLTAKSPYNSSELELVVPADIPEVEVKKDPVPTPVSYPAAPADEQDVSGKLFVSKQGADTIYPMFKIETATAIKDENLIYVTVQVNKAASGAFTYSYLYFGTRTALVEQLDAGGEFGVVAGVAGSETQAYHFTLPLSAAGTRVPVCILKGDLNEKSPYNSSELELVVPTDIPEVEVKKDPVPTPVSYPAAPVAERDITGLTVVEKETDTAYADFPIASATGIKVDGQLYITALVSANAEGSFPYSYLYFGTKAQLEEQLSKGGAFSVVAAVVNGQTQNYHFTLSAEQAGTRVPVCLLKADLTAENPYNAAELELVIPEIPEEIAEAAPAIPALPDTLSEAGIKVIKVEDGTEFKMFAASKTGMVVAGDKLLIHFETTNTSYDALYFGSKEDGLKSPYVQGVQKDGSWVFEFELPASYRGAQNPICLRKTDGTWYSSKDLLISIPADSGDSATVNDDAGIQMYPVGQFSQTSFAISSSSAMLLGDQIYVTITGKMAENGKYSDKVAGMLYLGSRYDKDKTPYITGTLNADGTTTFTFTVPADKQGTSICAVVGYTDGTWDPTNLDFFLNIPNFGRSFDLSYYTDGVYDLYGNAYAYLDKADRRSLPFDVGSTLTVSGDQITIKWVTRGNDTDKLYFGLQTDDKATREAQSILAQDCTDNPDTSDYKVFYVTLSKSVLGTQIPFVRHSRLWWTDTDGWLESQDYVIFSDYLTRTSDKPDDSGTTIDDAGMKMLAGGSEVEQMFLVTESSATLKGDTITCTITGKPAGRNSGTADKLYLGSRDDADKSNFIVGTLNDDETTTFVFDVPAEKQGTSIPVVVSFTGSGWDTTQDYFLNIPDFGTSFDLSYYTDGVYDLYGNSYAELSRTQNRSFPVDKGSTLSVAGNKIVIKWVTRTGSYDKLYFGSASDDEETRNAGAVEIEDYAGEATWKVYTVTLPKSALSARIPFARHSTKWYTATNGWLTTQDYLVLANRLPKLSDTPDIPVDPTEPTEPSEPGGEISDGTYNTTGETGASMFKVVKAVLDASGGKYKVTLTLSGTAYDYLCPGTAADAPANQSQWVPAKVVNCTINGVTKDWYTYTMEVDDPTVPIVLASHSKNKDLWYDRTVTLDTTNLKRTAKDGSYQVTTECDAAMFRIIDAKLKIVNGQIMADITLSGQGYDYLYPGTGAQADAETDKANWAPFRVNEDGKYVYTIPISALDEFIPIGSHSSAKNQWFDRSVKFLSNSLVAIGGTDPTDPTTPTTPTDPTDPTTPTTPTDPTTPTTPVTPTDPTDPSDPTEEPTVPSEPDLDGSTTVVDNSTGLKDGTYTPDGFSFSGGTGKTRIVCDKIIVKGGKSFAVIRFVSTTGSPSAYKYVKASGGVYYPTASGAFTIPVALNKNNRILGMTTKMTAAHEIEYILFVQKKGADPSDPTDPTDPDDGGTTSAVDNSTNLKDKDGYKPDSVTSSGGTNGTKVICDKVIVKGGKSYAVIKIVDASGNVVAHEYVKASGGKYDPASNGTFTIPVKLNAENRILAKPVGEDADEVEYKINIKVKGASSGGSSTQTEEEKEEDDPDSKLDKQAPEILGLEFKELIATPGARYLKLFQYDQGVVLAEVDLRRDTVLDTDEAIEELAQADKAAKEAQGETADVQSDEPTDNAQITADYIAELYQKDILKYLLVPEDVELPAGLEKQYLIVHVPASNVYLMDEDLGDTLKALDVLNSVIILGSNACEDDVIQELLESGEAIYGGTWEKPDYRTLIRAKMGMGLMSSDLLPLSEETLKERKENIPQREALTAVEYRDRMTKLTERFAVLGVPMLVDRAADEPTAKGQAAWLKLYGLLYGKETQANKLYDAAVAKEEKA